MTTSSNLDFLFGARSVLHQTLIEVQPSGCPEIWLEIGQQQKAYCFLRPRNDSVPLCRPMQRVRVIAGHPQLDAGSGKGQNR